MNKHGGHTGNAGKVKNKLPWKPTAHSQQLVNPTCTTPCFHNRSLASFRTGRGRCEYRIPHWVLYLLHCCTYPATFIQSDTFLKLLKTTWILFAYGGVSCHFHTTHSLPRPLRKRDATKHLQKSHFSTWEVQTKVDNILTQRVASAFDTRHITAKWPWFSTFFVPSISVFCWTPCWTPCWSPFF